MKLKLTLTVLILLEVFWVMVLVTPSLPIDSTEKARLAYEVQQHPELREHPTDEFKARVHAMHRRESIETFILNGTFFACIVANGWAIFVIVRKIRAKNSSPC